MSSLQWLILAFPYAFLVQWSIFPTKLNSYPISYPPPHDIALQSDCVEGSTQNVFFPPKSCIAERERVNFACRPALRSRQKPRFLAHFQTFFSDFSCEITEKALKWTKKVKKRLKKRFQPAFGCTQHPKAGRNTQQLSDIKWSFKPAAHSHHKYSFVSKNF